MNTSESLKKNIKNLNLHCEHFCDDCPLQVVKLATECWQLQRPMLADSHVLLLRSATLLADSLAYLQSPKEATQFALLTVTGYRKIYPPFHATLGLAMLRAGMTHWQAGCIEEAHGLLCQAMSVLLVTHGPLHPITKDLQALRVQTEMELRMFRENEIFYEQMRQKALQGGKMVMMAEPLSAPQSLFGHSK
uniref:Uncharacterized protein n=1 Tax=Eptatretus burgeri TaxID=7764 RepID=A0A8C4Q088_EPTBU